LLPLQAPVLSVLLLACVLWAVLVLVAKPVPQAVAVAV
jgi:hypothetical protein